MKEIFEHPDSSKYLLFATTGSWVDQLVQDILAAKHYVYVETFRLNDDVVGQRVGQAMLLKAAEGLDVKLIVDSWGTRKSKLIADMEKGGVCVRYFKKIILTFNLFGRNHTRNHRKIVAIDDQVSYIGSANFSKWSLKWRESILRVENHDLARIFKRIFLENFEIYKKKIKKRKYYKTINHDGFKIIRETPSIMHQKSKNYFMNLINKAKKNVTIVTPYFLTGKSMRDKLAKAVKRGVKVTVILPKHSDVRSVDYLRDLFLGTLYRNGIRLKLFKSGNIHAKMVMIDDHVFSIGSTNFDYRSFRYMHEINLSGEKPEISQLVKEYMDDTLTECSDFNYARWVLRPLHQKIIGMMLYPIRRLM
ncbi:phosphatidylserine/phosphatidylglycerophosphate/cardiolipin synthase family protein [Bacteroidales bacterium OttesenSCG-928-B11]|nr:phosphatidylserine/phosphatidylglycerophosphate/cardiolipin synthase family protein [Bacteroidales bacterium OttesenSCG-928-E04]MDL2311367.1 phosphatidylserine/phosphatidylglycerophosphate/cardiolipin synthase family protein [Bacteroidales bacterium OttesenSCG-928-B11]MDL2326019.1 phosphatidylserine/phosphatidylglycerophosphate/cardiolipin synthase family protein [Bacteroidales bacterium OttesenSCG-928-A14]